MKSKSVEVLEGKQEEVINGDRGENALKRLKSMSIWGTGCRGMVGRRRGTRKGKDEESSDGDGTGMGDWKKKICKGYKEKILIV